LWGEEEGSGGGKAVFITSDLLERTINGIDIIRNEFFIVTED
jgi:hypothetical protein